MENTNMVSNKIRNANKRAIEARDAWRVKYQEVTLLIKLNKAVGDRTSLTALRFYANVMMIGRSYITDDLRATAYKWI